MSLTISTVEYVDNAKRRTPFIAADGHAKTQRISASLRESYNVVNKPIWSKYVDNSKRRSTSLYHSTGTPNRTEHDLFVCILKPK